MTTGSIDQDRHAVIPTDVFDRDNRLRRVEAIIDTGFDDFLALSLEVVQNLGLTWAGRLSMQVATAQSESFDVYAATVWWFGNSLPIRVLQSPDEIIVGTRLLWESELTVRFWEGGSVNVPLRSP